MEEHIDNSIKIIDDMLHTHRHSYKFIKVIIKHLLK